MKISTKNRFYRFYLEPHKKAVRASAHKGKKISDPGIGWAPTTTPRCACGKAKHIGGAPT